MPGLEEGHGTGRVLDAASDQFHKLGEVIVPEDSQLKGATSDEQSERGEDVS